MPIDSHIFGGPIIHALELLGFEDLGKVIDRTERGACRSVPKINFCSIEVIDRRVLIGDELETKVAKLGDVSADGFHGACG